MQNTYKSVIDLVTKGGITAILAFIIIYFGGQFLQNQNEMQKELASIRVQLVKIQSSLLTEDKVKEMIDDKIKVIELKYHK